MLFHKSCPTSSHLLTTSCPAWRAVHMAPGGELSLPSCIPWDLRLHKSPSHRQVQPCPCLTGYPHGFSFRQSAADSGRFLLHSRDRGGWFGDVRGSSPPTVVRLQAWDSPPARRLPSGLELQQEDQGLLLWGSCWVHSPIPNLLWLLGKVQTCAVVPWRELEN